MANIYCKWHAAAREEKNKPMNDALQILEVFKQMFEAETPRDALNIMMCNYDRMTKSQLIMGLEIVHSKWKGWE